MITLKNGSLTVKINEKGAEIKSIRSEKHEYLWEGKDEIWASSAPLLFPICGGLKEDKYTYMGKTYTLPKHGYARFMDFEVTEMSDTAAVFLHKSNEETKKCFPFDYELYVIYTLSDLSLSIEYRVKNKTDGKMYFSIGSHEGFYTPEGVEEYDVIFDKKVSLSTSALYGNLLSENKTAVLNDSSVLPLYDKYFAIDALVFRDIEAREVTLRNRKTGKALRMDFEFAPHFLLWHKYASPFICLEPWAGLPDIVGSSYELSEKAGIITLEKEEIYSGVHTITVIE